MAERIKFIRDRVGQGIDPLYVGVVVREGVENDSPYHKLAAILAADVVGYSRLIRPTLGSRLNQVHHRTMVAMATAAAKLAASLS